MTTPHTLELIADTMKSNSITVATLWAELQELDAMNDEIIRTSDRLARAHAEGDVMEVGRRLDHLSFITREFRHSRNPANS